MIVFDLQCRDAGHRFEGWFGSSDDFTRQQVRGLVTCPVCGSAAVEKALTAPNLGRKSNQKSEHRPLPKTPAQPAPMALANTPDMPPQLAEMISKVAQIQAEAIKSSRWVGSNFAETARAIHYGDQEAEQVHGQATPQEARDLIEEGVEIAPLLIPVIPPDEAN